MLIDNERHLIAVIVAVWFGSGVGVVVVASLPGDLGRGVRVQVGRRVERVLAVELELRQENQLSVHGPH